MTLFIAIAAVMLLVTGWASTVQPVWEWTGLTSEPDHAWTIATLVDAYCGFLTFYVWVWWKEHRAASRLRWFVAIMLLGNIAMATYVLLQLRRLGPDASIDALLTRRNS